MRKIKSIVVMLLFSLLCSSFFILSKEKDETKAVSKENVTIPGNGIDNIQKEIDKMSVEEKIGQLVIAGVDGLELVKKDKSLLTVNKVGGIIIMGKNVESTKRLKKLIDDIKSANKQNNIPLFLSVDEEGGRVSRMPSVFVRLPTNEVIGKRNNTAFSYEIGSIISEELKGFGFNMNFAPVLDINSNTNNPVIGDRSYGTNAEIVSKLGISTMDSLKDNKIIAVVKHFPGHGDTSVDSHIDLPIVNVPLEKLRSFEFLPFSRAIKKDVDGIMMGHILLKKIDNKYPASLSKKVITEILRRDLGFKGVVFTDDLTMGAITKQFTIGDAAVKSIIAGADVVLVCHENKNVKAVLASLKKAVKSNEISEKRLDKSVYRILTLKEKYKLTDRSSTNIDVSQINKRIAKLLAVPK